MCRSVKTNIVFDTKILGLNLKDIISVYIYSKAYWTSYEADLSKQYNWYVKNRVRDISTNPRDFYRFINSQRKDPWVIRHLREEMRLNRQRTKIISLLMWYVWVWAQSCSLTRQVGSICEKILLYRKTSEKPNFQKSSMLPILKDQKSYIQKS